MYMAKEQIKTLLFHTAEYNRHFQQQQAICDGKKQNSRIEHWVVNVSPFYLELFYLLLTFEHYDFNYLNILSVTATHTLLIKFCTSLNNNQTSVQELYSVDLKISH